MNKSDFAKKFPKYKDYYEKLNLLVGLVESKSKVVNITAIRDTEGIWNKHIADSLMISNIKLIDDGITKGIKILDLGTGGGFPGLPLATIYPNSKFVLMDSTRKKLNAVNEFSQSLNLKNVETVWSRAEDLHFDSKFSQSFDLVVVRSVSYLPELIELVRPFLAKNGRIATYKKFDKIELISAEKTLINNKMKLEQEFIYETDRVIWIFGQLTR